MALLKDGTRIYGNATIDGSLTTASPDKSTASTVVATTLSVKQLFASQSTSGTLDWNDVSNTRPGVSPTLLLGSHTNGPGGGNYYHPLNIEYAGVNGTGNLTQLAIAYGTPANDLKMRGRYQGAWTGWVTFLNSSNFTSYSLSASNTSTQSGYFGDIFLFDDSTPSHYLGITNSANLTAARTLSLNVNDANRTISLSGDLTLANSFTTSGNFALTLTTTAATNVTLPTSGTLATTAGTLSSSTTSTQDGYFGNIALYDDSTPSHYLTVTNSANLTAARTLSVNVNDADRTISLSGNLTVSNTATVSGTNTGDQTITLTGDVTGTGTGSFATTLANSGVTAGTYNDSATAVRPFTVDAKGRVTGIGTAVTIAPAFSSITSKPTTLSGYGITDALSTSTTSTQSGYFGDIFLYDDSTPSHYLQISNSSNLTAARGLFIDVNDNSRTISLSGNLTLANSFITSGNFSLTLTTTAATNVTLPTSGTLATTAGTLSSANNSTQIGYFGDIALFDDTNPSHYLFITNSGDLGLDRILSVDVNNANRSISLSGNLSLANSFTTSGNFALTLTTTAATNVTLPTSGTLLTTTGSGSSLTFGTGSLSLAGNLTTTGAFTIGLTATAATSVTLPTSGTLATTAGTLSSATNSTQSGYFGDIFLYDDSTPSHYLGITNSANLTAARTLSINVNDANRTLSLSGDLTLANSFTTSGNFALTLTTTAATNVTLPTSGTLATTAGTLSSATNSTQSGYFGDIFLFDDATPSNYLQITAGSNLTATRTLTLLTADANRTVTLGGDLSISNSFSTSGGHTLTLTTTAATNVTLPTSGTLVNSSDLANVAGTVTALNTAVLSYELDDISTAVDGIENTFVPKFNYDKVALTDPFKLLITINGIIQSAYVFNTDYVHLTHCLAAKSGYTIDQDGNIKFTESLPMGSEVVARLNGSSTHSVYRYYPFSALDIMLYK